MKKKYLIMTGDKILEETTNKRIAKNKLEIWLYTSLFETNDVFVYKKTPFGLFPDLYIKEVQND